MYRNELILLGASILLTASPAAAQDLATALSLEQQGRLGDALDAFESALRQPESSREELATVYVHLAVLRFGLGDRDGARQALQGLAELDRDAELPGSAPPELQELHSEVMTEWGARRFDATVDAPTSVRRGESAIVRLSVIDDLAELVAGARLVEGERIVVEMRGRGPSFELAVPETAIGGGRVTLTPRLVNEHGATLWQGSDVTIEASLSRSSLEDEGEGGDVADTTAGASGARYGRPLRIAGWALLGTSLGAIAAGGALVGIDGSVIETRLVEGRPQERRYTTALPGWVLVGVAGAGLATAVVLVVLGTRSRGAEALVLRLASGELARW